MKLQEIVTRRPEITIGFSALLIAALVASFFYQAGDAPAELKRSGEHLLRIYRALQSFQSEEYFGHPPENLSQLAQYKAVYYISRMDNSGKPENSFLRIERNYSLLLNSSVLFIPDNADKIAIKDEPDYGFLPWYERFMPENTIIAWDKPGNFKSGGNVLLYNGEVRICQMKTDEYKLFIRSLRSKSGRDFVRQKCPGVSVAGFSKEFADEDVTSSKVDNTALQENENSAPAGEKAGMKVEK